MVSADPILGQVFTPAPVADLTLALALEGSSGAPRLIDPACGDGVFLVRAAARGVPAGRLVGVDVDPAAAGAARARLPGAQVACADFMTLPPPEEPFDAVVGNPPYVRQELLGAARKRAIAARVAEDWPGLPPLPGRADLALAFVARALRFVRPGGRVAFVLSSAVLDAGYGDALRALLAGRARLATIVASPRERWFPDAAVHGVIVVLERDTRARPARFARLRVRVAEAHGDLHRCADVRTAPAEAPWAPLLRAPDAWFEAARAAGDLLVPLSDLADIRRGATSGANDFFYVSRAAAARAGIEPRFLVPVLKSPRGQAAIRVAAGELPVLAFVCPVDRTSLARWPGARAWIDRHAALAARPTLAARPRWWSLAARPARLFLTKAYSARFVQHLATRPVIADQRVYAVRPRAGVPIELLAAALNSTPSALALESLGRASMGEGALEWSVADARALPVLDVRRLRASRAVLAAFRALAPRAADDVFAEAAAADRRALDLALLPPALRKLLPSLRDALLSAVADRLARSRP